MSDSIILHNVTPETLQEMIQTVVRSEIKTMAPKPEEPNYLTRSDVCQRLHISFPTLGKYVKKGILKGKKIGRRVLFEEKDIKQALQEMPSRK